MRSDLTDHYYEELQELKTRHALEQEQLRAKLSDRHLQGSFWKKYLKMQVHTLVLNKHQLSFHFRSAELTRVHLEAAHQVEVR